MNPAWDQSSGPEGQGSASSQGLDIQRVHFQSCLWPIHKWGPMLAPAAGATGYDGHRDHGPCSPLLGHGGEVSLFRGPLFAFQGPQELTVSPAVGTTKGSPHNRHPLLEWCSQLVPHPPVTPTPHSDQCPACGLRVHPPFLHPILIIL